MSCCWAWGIENRHSIDKSIGMFYALCICASRCCQQLSSPRHLCSPPVCSQETGTALTANQRAAFRGQQRHSGGWAHWRIWPKLLPLCTGKKKHPFHRCGESYWGPSEVKHHLDTAHLQKELCSCDQCEKSFGAKYRPEWHLQAHAGVEQHICSHCGRGFLCPEVLKTHLCIHSGERPYACTLCEKRLSQPCALTLHLRLHRGEKLNLCVECGRAFLSSGALLIRWWLHTGDRPYHCKGCGKCFITLQGLRVHQWFHTDERQTTPQMSHRRETLQMSCVWQKIFPGIQYKNTSVKAWSWYSAWLVQL